MTEAEKTEPADLCLINTCSVTGEADHKCRQLIHRAARENPNAFMVVTGCYAQLEPATVAKIPGVDLVLGSNEKANLIQYLNDAWSLRLHHAQPDTAELDGGKDGGYYHHVKTKDIKSFQPSCSRGNRTRYFLKVQDGCEQFCTYCIIPYARGPLRSRSMENTLQEAKKLEQAGFREIILTGIHLGAYGKPGEAEAEAKRLVLEAEANGLEKKYTKIRRII